MRFDLGYPAVSWNLKPYAKFRDVFKDHSLTVSLQTDLKKIENMRVEAFHGDCFLNGHIYFTPQDFLST